MLDLQRFLVHAIDKAGTKRAAAAAIGIQETHFNSACTGQRSIPEQAARNLAAYLGEPEAAVMRAKVEAEPKYRRLLKTAAILLFVGVSASTSQHVDAADESGTYFERILRNTHMRIKAALRHLERVITALGKWGNPPGTRCALSTA